MKPILAKNITELIKEEYQNITGIVISDKNEIIYENYFQGYKKEDTVHIASVTKSIISILIGIAIDKGLIKSIQQPLIDYFPNYTLKKREKVLPHITIEQVLTMTAPYKFKYEPYTKVYASEDWTKSALDLLGGKKLSEDFKYTTVGIQVLSGLICNATGSSVLDFATKHLFLPLEINPPKPIRIHTKDEHFAFLKNKHVHGWVTDPKGVNTSGWGICLTTRDVAKIGQLYLKEGKWNNQQLVSSNWIQKSTITHSQWNDKSYGYLWWVINPNTYAAIGDSGNIILVDKKLELVIAITSSFKPRAKDRITLITEKIIPNLHLY
ncbi:serine hydrolase [Pseudalgibacter alginicilyticus]|uniref:Serine hydrolase n=1 Tax=Pseudalgibacter alginicilyticus TaxID=1736674 RepID=A0A0N7HYV4_9FLAO|nr:serine hydrolase [Pseudalgibacter alginicilyticus]ALJ06302.1 serine hydrolase [Pseudalgibacter alginicilyticus]